MMPAILCVIEGLDYERKSIDHIYQSSHTGTDQDAADAIFRWGAMRRTAYLFFERYFAESTTAKKELASIKESEYPLAENIL